MPSWVIAVGLLALSPLDVEANEPPRIVVSKARALTFTQKDAVVGQAEEVRMGMQMELAFYVTAPDMEPEPIDVSSEMAQILVHTVLEAKGPVVTRARIAYDDVVDVMKDPEGRQKRVVAPVSHKTYVGAFKEGRIEVTDTQGQPVSPEEVEAVRKDLGGLGEVDPVAAAFPKGAVKVGMKLEPVARALEKFLQQGNPPSARFHKTRVQLHEVHEDPRGPIGLFSLSTTLEIAPDEQSPLTTTIAYQGTMRVLAEGARLLSFNVEGPVTYTPTPARKAQGMKVKGKGHSVLFFSAQPPGQKGDAPR
ncbi:hypothetical protein MFU01_07180 [Myxococcus fulvus]|nr:hypothetical protein MFU01_07180 [Myxococcus fulvus]